MADIPKFHWADYLVLGLFFLFSIGLGVVIAYRGRKKSATSTELLLGGGDMHWFPTALSMQASFLSAVTLLSTPTEIYSFGTMYSFFGLTYISALPIAAYMFMPTFYRLRLISGYEYLEIRFNRIVRLAGSVTFSLMVILYLSVVLYTPALALAQVSGLEVELSVAICGIVCTIYTVLGGMKATMWNDFFQMLIVIASLVMVIVIGAIRVGGMSYVWDVNQNGSRIEFNNFDPDPTVRTTFWSQMIGGTTIHIAMYASSQTVIQKFLSVKTLRLAQRAVWMAVATSVLIFVLVTIIGLIMYAYYEKCDPLTNGQVERADQLVPLFIMDIMGDLHGLPGLFIASAFSAALSSVSGSLNALSAVFLVDFIGPAYKNSTGNFLKERASSILTRVLTLIFGVVTIALGLCAKYFGSLVLQIALSIFGFIGGPLTGTLALGLFFPCVNSIGALCGLVVSLIISSWVAIGALIHNDIPLPKLEMRTDGCDVPPFDNSTTQYFMSTTEQPEPVYDVLWIYQVSYMYYGLLSMATAFIVGVVVSLITGRSKDTDKRLVFSWGSECCCYCPAPCRECLACGAVDTPDDAEELRFSAKKNGVVAVMEINGNQVYPLADVEISTKMAEADGGGYYNPAVDQTDETPEKASSDASHPAHVANGNGSIRSAEPAVEEDLEESKL